MLRKCIFLWNKCVQNVTRSEHQICEHHTTLEINLVLNRISDSRQWERVFLGSRNLWHAVESVFSGMRSWKYFRSFCTRRKAAQLRGRRLGSCRYHYGGLRRVHEAVEHALSVAPRAARARCPAARSTIRTGGRRSWAPDGAPCRWCLLALFCCYTQPS